MGVPRSVNRMYDRASYETPRMHWIGTGITGTLLGTVSTTATLANVFTCPTNMRLISATGIASNGGTVSGTFTPPQFAIIKKLAGTGANEIALTALYGTRADATWVQLDYSSTGTANDCTRGDVLAFGAVAGTTADTSQIFNLHAIFWEELY